ncbi:hypothetical protein Pmani_013090 [Petrolisthes manimaculis]|uniref:Peptidase M28 domain-containing protein n=1 Tax=Petrolisthes manimaculis TaxID=1843537 RepID=A0AAE1PVY7_9EUCA|nr:hypothetical protein Pmani_013090 [Petrolisthes manimaculis]
MDEDDIDIKKHMKPLATQRFPSGSMNEDRLHAKEYIKDTFRQIGLRVVEHRFNTSINPDLTGTTYDQEVVEGVNVIGIADGVSSKPGAVVLVGADYDTSGTDDPMYNNGAGIAVMLEAAYQFYFNTHWSGMYVLNYTTIFVAFDLNTREHVSGSGKPGGRHFVEEWLWNFLNQSSTNFGGAVILDSVMNVNYEEASQRNDQQFADLYPDTQERLVESKFKGDFLGLVTVENDEKNVALRDLFTGLYNKDRKRRPFHLEDLSIRRGVNMNTMVEELTKQESYHFWTFSNNNNQVPLPAILLTDTQKLRTRAPNPSCERICRPEDLLTEERVEFMEATTNGLIHFLMRRQGTRKEDLSGAMTSLPSVFTLPLVLLFGRLFH